MRLFRWAMMVALLAILGVAVHQTLLFFEVWGQVGESQVKPLDDDDQEIALIEPATSIDDWGRLVTAIRMLKADWARINPDQPELIVSLDNAFPDLTADVSEIVITLDLKPRKHLRLRWYKISGEHDVASWIRKLHARPRQPLAIVGGGTSDRAVRLALALRDTYPDPAQPSPALLITTATAEKTSRGNPLIDLYARRTFRLAFTNQIIVESLLQFVHDTPGLGTHKATDPRVLASAVTCMIGAGDFVSAAAILRGYPELQPYTMHAVSWQDERYSLDMTDLFEHEFKKRFPLSEFFLDANIRSGVGEFFQPAPQEQGAVGTFLARQSPVSPNSFLVLPTGTVRMRRFLINLRQRSPQDARNLIILNGDAVAFHAVYRDRNVMWNILDLPYSLLFFSHRDPINASAGFTWNKDDRIEAVNAFPQRTTTGTHDVLLYRDLFETLIYAAFDQGRLVADSHRMRDRLHTTCWYVPPLDRAKQDPARVCNTQVHPGRHRPFFDASGNRQRHTGEHIIWVKPNFTDDRVDLTSRITIWTIHPDRDAWLLVESHDAIYNQTRPEEIAP